MPTVLVTGANRGLGLELARQYAADGWRVLAGCRDPDAATALAGFARVERIALDIADPASIAAAVASLRDTKLDLLLHNAAISGGWARTLEETTYDEFEQVLRVNVLGPFELTRAALPLLAQGAVIALLSSELGSIGNTGTGNFYAYRASKAALNMLGTCLAHELGLRGIATVLLHPGWVHTDMGGANAPLDPATSVQGLRQRIAETNLRNSGRYIAYDGRRLAW